MTPGTGSTWLNILIARPLDYSLSSRVATRAGMSVAWRIALAQDECIAHFEPPKTWNARLIGAGALKRQRGDRIVFVIESPACRDGGIEHEGRQYLCPSCLFEASSSTLIFPVRYRNAFRSRAALSTSACRRFVSGTVRGQRATMSGGDNRLPALDVIKKLGR
jgi:hypothetical protein